LFLGKEAGLYRVVGGSDGDFSAEPWDSTVQFVAPRARTTLEGRAYALSNAGVVVWNENSRPQPASVNIEATLRDLVAAAPAEVRSHAYMVAYPSDRKLLLAMPSGPGATSATHYYVLNTLTGAWTRWVLPSTTALVQPTDGKLYIAGTDGQVYRERKSGTDADYQGPDGEAITATVQWVPHVGPGIEYGKVWNGISFAFQGTAPAYVDAYFSTDATPATSPAIRVDRATAGTSPGTLSVQPTLDYMRSAVLNVGLTHGIAGAPLRLQGYTSSFRAYKAKR
jgi:hypothetical protein